MFDFDIMGTLAAMDLNELDPILIGLPLLLGLRGAIRGLVGEILGVATVAGAVFIAMVGQPLIRPGLGVVLDMQALADGTAYVLAFVAGLVIMKLAVSLLSKVFEAVCPVPMANRLGGLIMGAAKGLLFSVAVLILLRVIPGTEALVANSAIAGMLTPLADFLGGQMAERTADTFVGGAMPIWA